MYTHTTYSQTQQLPILGISFRVGIIIGTIFFSLLNYINVFKVILSRGAGKNGSTVAVMGVVLGGRGLV